MIRSAVDRWFDRFRQKGDPAALAKVFDRTAPELWRVASHLCRDRHAAEDAVQNTFLVAIEHKAQWDGSRPLLPWLLGLLANRAREQRRLAASRLDPARVGGPQHEPDPAASAQRVEFGQALHRALREVAEPYRSALEQHLVHGVAASELADRLGVSAGTVRMRLHRGLDLLRRRLPVGFVAGAALVLAPAQLSAMRAAVLANVPGGGKVVVGGGLSGAMLAKSLLLALAAGLGVVALSWTTWSQFGEVGATSPASVCDANMIAQVSEGASSPRLDEAPGPDADPVVRQAAPVIAGGLRVVLRNAGNQEPVVGAVVEVTIGALRHVQVLAPRPAGSAATAVPATTTAVAARDVQTATTDAAGIATFELPPGPAEFAVRDFGNASHAVAIAEGEVLERAVDLPVLVDADVTVLDAEGRPVAGASIVGCRMSRAGDLDEGELGRTGSDGHWRQPCVERTVVVRAVADGLAASEAVLLQSGNPCATLRLGGPAASLVGTVYALDGQPVPNARLAIEPRQEDSRSTIARRVRADAAGRYRCDHLAPGQHAVFAWVEHHGNKSFAVADAVPMARGEQRVDVHFTAGARFSAQLLQSSGRPWPRVPVSLQQLRHLGMGLFVGAEGTTDEQGRLVLDHLLPGDYEVIVSVPNDTCRELLQLVEGQTCEFTRTLGGRAWLEIVALDEQRQPLVGWTAQLRVRAPHAAVLPPRTPVASRVTGSGGVARFDLLPGQEFEVSLHREERGLSSARQAVVVNERTEILVGAAQLPDAELRASLPQVPGVDFSDLNAGLVRLGEGDELLSSEQIRGSIDAAGTLQFAGLTAGTYHLMVLRQTPGPWPFVAMRLGIEVAPGARVDLGQLAVGQNHVRCRVVRPDGAGVSGATVRLGVGRVAPFVGDTSSQNPGVVEFENVPPGDYEAFIWGDDITPMTIAVTVPATGEVELPLRVAPAAAVTVKVTGGGALRTFCHLGLRRADGGEAVASQICDLSLPLVRGLPPGRYVVEIQTVSGEPPLRASATITVGEEPVVVELRLGD